MKSSQVTSFLFESFLSLFLSFIYLFFFNVEDKADVDEIEDEEIMDLTENETESESEEELIEDKKEKKVKNPFVDDEAEVSEGMYGNRKAIMVKIHICSQVLK